MTPPTAIRVPLDGLAWPAGVQDTDGDGLLMSTGVTFDSLEMARVPGERVIVWLLATMRPIGPVALDARAGRVRFLIPPGSRPRVPDVVATLIGKGGAVRLPSLATTADASLRWLIAPRLRGPRLTDPDDLRAGITACVLNGASSSLGPDSARLLGTATDFPRRSAEPRGDRVRYLT
jgi:hypothetical protein